MTTEPDISDSLNQHFDLYKTLSQLDEIKEFSSKFNSKRSKYIFDNVSIDDPFNKEALLDRLNLKDSQAKDIVNTLITKFEQSLDRVLNCQAINKENALESYRKMLQHNLDVALDIKPSKLDRSKEIDTNSISINRLLFDVSDSQKEEAEQESTKHAPIKKRKQLSREAKRFLEAAFKAKRDPNSKERQLIAEKSGLSTMQVRVWFTNKRMRSK